MLSDSSLPTFRFHIQGSSNQDDFLKMGPIDCPETSVRNYHSKLRNIPEERRSQEQACFFTRKKLKCIEYELNYSLSTSDRGTAILRLSVISNPLKTQIIYKSPYPAGIQTEYHQVTCQMWRHSVFFPCGGLVAYPYSQCQK